MQGTTLGGKTMIVIIGLVLFVVFMAMCGAAYQAMAPTFVRSDNQINMIQPCGWFFCSGYDRSSADINQTNSEANKNNGEAHAYDAVATKTVAEADQIHVNNYGGQAVTYGEGVYTGWVTLCCGAFVFLVLGTVVLTILQRVTR